MKKILYTALLPTVALCLSQSVNAQQVTSSSGGTGQNTSGSIAYTLGELVIETKSANNKIITQGFHQTRLIITAITEAKGLAFEIKAFPNPATNLVKIEVSEAKNLTYTLHDLNGRVLSAGNVLNDETEIAFDLLAPST